MRKLLFNSVKKLIPKISETELIALRSGNTSIDRQIFEGKVKLPSIKPQIVTPSETYNVFNKKSDSLLNKYGDNKIYPNTNHKEIFNYLGSNKFFSFIIDEKYGGNKLSVSEMSSLLVKISSYNPSLGVSIMVPNSLGPGELLQEYGTQQQKEKYLPGLVTGEYIPCFGLTGPENGSDAGGNIDVGVVKKNKEGKVVIDVTVNKRYITLAPVSNLVGLAFNLEDPNNLLEKGQEGITVALLEGNHKGLNKTTHHNPLDAGFPNGTVKGKLEINLDQIIGGEELAGNGWKMLMECLAAGRGVCLPATALASAKASTWGVYQFGQHRKQFNIPIIKMEGVNEKWLDMLYQTWIIQCSVNLTNVLLEQGDKPAVISALMKQQTTERAREVINHGMDIHAGSAICQGYSNFIEKFYKSAPIGITVEGSNTLTRSLIIFGQGLNKSHPYIFPILSTIMENNEKEFGTQFGNMVGHTIKRYLSSYNPFMSELDKQTVNFAALSNFIALKGGKLKKEQYLSGKVADYFSNLYLAYSVKWYQEQFKVSETLTKYCIDRLMIENKSILKNILNNEPSLRRLFWHLTTSSNDIKFEKQREILKEVENNKNILEHIKQDLYLKDNILGDLEILNNHSEDSKEYQISYNKAINVGEYRND